ncbi:DUF3445 domain-containing protein [Motilibacter sp. K478]|nr:DUF3445 domain-containing protein [Motilibacter aurantiacus]
MPAPRYLPFEPGPHRHRVGTRTLDVAGWIELGDDADAQLAQKRSVLADHPDEAVAVLDGPPGPGAGTVRAAGDELLAVLEAHLVGRFPDRYARDGGTLRDPRSGQAYVDDARGLHPVDAAARLVPEDLCLHLPGADGALRLVAASVAFPSRWRLADKLGLPVGEIHTPVPGYAAAIGAPVDLVMSRLTPERGLWRLNGSVLDDPALFQPEPAARPGRAEVPGGVFLRAERQTLRRLPRTGAVVFTIRTYVDPLGAIGDDPAACAQVAAWLRGMPAGLRDYKSLRELGPAVLAWLDSRAGPPTWRPATSWTTSATTMTANGPAQPPAPCSQPISSGPGVASR